MRHSLARSIIVLLLLQPLLSPAVVFGQEVRQRRTQIPVEPRPDEPPKIPGQTTSGEWRPPVQKIVTLDQSDAGLASQKEPTIRVALATNVRAATISTTGHLMNASDEGSTLVAMDVTRVRLEPRLLSPVSPVDNADLFKIQLAGFPAREDAEQKSREVQEASGEDTQILYDTESKTWGLLVGSRRPQLEAEELRGRLEDAGFDAAVVPVGSSSGSAQVQPTQASSSEPSIAKTKSSSADYAGAAGNRNVRPVARFSLPSREVVASAPGAGQLFRSSAPVTLASDSETTPLRFNDRPYRGRIEVFTNLRGALTVVNVLGIEDYVKGVVPNELSAGGFPLLEAHKAQAIAARTYALRNRGQFMSEGYDLLPTTRSQVYRGLVSENPLSTRAVDETRGMVATYEGQPINALYTSTCGGRTEDAGNIFNDSVAYLRGRECAAEGRAALAPFTVKTTRDPVELKEDQNVAFLRDVAILTTLSFVSLKARISDSWLKDEVDVSEVRSWLASVARLSHQTAPAVGEDVDRPPAFATALSLAAYGESRAGTLLSDADITYYLAMRDADEIPAANRADVAMLIRDGYLSVMPDNTLRPQERLSRARALHAIARLLEARSLLQLQKGTARPTADGALILRSTKGKDLPIRTSVDTFLFRQIGEMLYPVRSVALVGGEPVVFHVNSAGEVDYLEVRPAPNGAAADRFSPFANWTAELSLSQAQSRLGRFASGIGPLVDLRVVSRGRSKRAIDLEVIGTDGRRQVLGGRIRSALGLREQLFVIEKKFDETGRVTGFTFLGRGWGHGVGMCQVGAYGLAKQGFTYDRILKAYYTGIELTRMY